MFHRSPTAIAAGAIVLALSGGLVGCTASALASSAPGSSTAATTFTPDPLTQYVTMEDTTRGEARRTRPGGDAVHGGAGL